MHRTTLFIIELLIIIVLLCLKDKKNVISGKSTTNFVTSSIFWKCKLLLFFLAEDNRPSSLSETNSNLVLSGSVCYSTEDEKVLSEARSKASLSLHTEEVLPYLFESECSELVMESTETLDTVLLGGADQKHRLVVLQDMLMTLKDSMKDDHDRPSLPILS